MNTIAKHVTVLLTALILLKGVAFADLFITEIADPNNNSGARYVEIYNNGESAVDLSTGWDLQRWTNDNSSPQTAVELTGTIAAGDFYIVCANQTTFTSTYGFAADQDIGTGGPADSNGDDQIALRNPSDEIVDMFGVVGEDGSGTNHEFEDGRAERKATVTSGNSTYTFSEWNIWNDTGGASTTNDPQDAPGDFDPGAWIGVADETAPSFSSTYPKTSSVTASGFKVAVSLNEAGTAYFVVLADGSSAPSSTQVKAGTDASDVPVSSTSKGSISVESAGTEYTGSASSLSSSTAYDVYVVAEDDESTPNIQVSPTKIDVTTAAAASAPTATTNSATSVNHNSATLNGTVNANNA